MSLLRRNQGAITSEESQIDATMVERGESEFELRSHAKRFQQSLTLNLRLPRNYAVIQIYCAIRITFPAILNWESPRAGWETENGTTGGTRYNYRRGSHREAEGLMNFANVNEQDAWRADGYRWTMDLAVFSCRPTAARFRDRNPGRGISVEKNKRVVIFVGATFSMFDSVEPSRSPCGVDTLERRCYNWTRGIQGVTHLRCDQTEIGSRGALEC
ncbi:hypothetical protein B0H16DRAFT_1474332 [Mycena metata]|uniref:Uncharacterized protein n=1 Tax=Mycena metata TaxID=1033252 RepID=A0AAD7HHF5_9AGAR|nr:hypothetical protein B0H16DRAFT_1474332 [Mycena metata]